MSAEVPVRSDNVRMRQSRGKASAAAIALGITAVLLVAEWLGTHGDYVTLPSVLLIVCRLPGVLLALLVVYVLPASEALLWKAGHGPPSGPLVWVSMAMCNILLCEAIRLFWNFATREPKRRT